MEQSYKEKYEQALSKAKDMLNYKEVRREDMEYLFPELAESEDEKVRKWCISHFKGCINVIKDNDEYKEYLSNKVLAWLEKQGQVKESAISQQENRTCEENGNSLTSEDAIEREVKEDAGGYPYIDATELYDYENDKPLAKAGDRVKVVFIKDK